MRQLDEAELVQLFVTEGKSWKEVRNHFRCGARVLKETINRLGLKEDPVRIKHNQARRKAKMRGNKNGCGGHKRVLLGQDFVKDFLSGLPHKDLMQKYGIGHRNLSHNIRLHSLLDRHGIEVRLCRKKALELEALEPVCPGITSLLENTHLTSIELGQLYDTWRHVQSLSYLLRDAIKGVNKIKAVRKRGIRMTDFGCSFPRSELEFKVMELLHSMDLEFILNGTLVEKEFDFTLSARKLIIEVDGGHHNEDYNRAWDEEAKDQGFMLIRLSGRALRSAEGIALAKEAIRNAYEKAPSYEDQEETSSEDV